MSRIARAREVSGPTGARTRAHGARARTGARALAGALALASLLTVAGCSGRALPAPLGGNPTSTGTKLGDALARVRSSAETKRYVAFDDTATLWKLATRDEPARTREPWSRAVFAGGHLLASQYTQLREVTGIDLLKASYEISAGPVAGAAALISGGQNASVVRERLQALGWTVRGDELRTPDLTHLRGPDPKDVALTLPLAYVRTDGTSVRYGNSGIDLNTVSAGAPSGKPSGTLAGDKTVDALANCLGDSVIALFDTGPTVAESTGTAATGLAVGYRRPGKPTDPPRVSICTTWPSEATATKAARSQLASALTGRSPKTLKPYAEIYQHPQVGRPSFGLHVVRLSAETPTSTEPPLRGFDNHDLPGLCALREGLPSDVRADIIEECHR